MSGLWSATISEAQGAVTPPADIDKYAVVVTCTSAGSAGLRGPYLTAAAIYAGVGYGDGPDIAAQMAEQRQTNGVSVAKVPVAVYKVPATTPGAYGAIDTSGVTGTVVAAVDSGEPFGTYRAAVRIVNGGTLGVDSDITYQDALDEAHDNEQPTWSVVRRLGLATSISIPNSGCGFDLTPSTTNAAYVALAVELRADTLAHLANVTAHDAADTSAAQVALAASSVPATVTASTAVVNLVLAAWVSHVTNISAHDGPDLVAYTALAALSAATTAKEGIDLAIDLKSIANTHMGVSLAAAGAGLKASTASIASPQTYTAAAHFLSGGVVLMDAQPRRVEVVISGSGTPADAPDSVTITGFDYADNAQTETGLSLTGLGTVKSTKAFKGTGLQLAFVAADGTGATFTIGYSNGVHNSADSTNTITSADPAYGTLVAGDTFFVYTTGPAPNATDLDDAFAALAASGKYFGIVAIGFDLSASLAAHVTTGLNTLRGRSKIAWSLAHTRLPDFEASEDEQTWADSVSAEYEVGTVDDSRIVLWSGYGWETDAATTRVYRRAQFAQFCADVIRVGIDEVPCAPVDQPATGLALWDANDTQVGHDEGPRGNVSGLSDDTQGNRFVCAVSTQDPLQGNAVQYTVPWTLAAATDNIKTMPMRRLACSMERSALTAAIGQGGALLDYTAPDPNVPGDTYKLTATSRNKLHGVIYFALSERFSSKIQNADDANPETGLVWINPAITVSAGKLVSVQYEIKPRFKGVLLSIAGTLVVQE